MMETNLSRLTLKFLVVGGWYAPIFGKNFQTIQLITTSSPEQFMTPSSPYHVIAVPLIYRSNDKKEEWCTIPSSDIVYEPNLSKCSGSLLLKNSRKPYLYFS